MNAITYTEARAVNTAAAIPLEAADPTKNLILVPLSRLVLRPTGRNVRKTPRMSIPELAVSIQRVGLLQNLIVIASADGEHYEVVAGGRRLAALKLLAKKHRISKEWEVPCLLVADGTARTASLTENVQREAMHPADQFEAFAALVAEGRPIEDIAADFSVTPLVVQRRLKLANVSPRLVADYRADAVTLDQLMALAITDDHAAQNAYHLGRFIGLVRSLSIDPIVVRQNWLDAYDYTTDKGAAVLNDYARVNDPFARIGRESVTVQIASVTRASDTSFNVRWTERRYVNGAAAGTERWNAVISIVQQTPRTEERLRKNPLGIYVNGLSWSRELDSSEGAKP